MTETGRFSGGKLDKQHNAEEEEEEEEEETEEKEEEPM